MDLAGVSGSFLAGYSEANAIQRWLRAADHHMEVGIGDVRCAFTQADTSMVENKRPGKIYATLPTIGMACFPGARSVEICGEIYGLSSAPQAWRNTFLGLSGRLRNPRESPDLPKASHQLGGMILLQVDDVLCASKGDKFQEAVQSLRAKFNFGKWSSLTEPRDYNGRTLTQLDTGRFVLDMTKFAKKVQLLDLPPARAQSVSAQATPAQVTQFHGVVDSLAWISRCGAPQKAAATSMLAGKASNLLVLLIEDMRECNKVVKFLQASITPLHIIGVEPWKRGVMVFSDASLANLEDQCTQVGTVIGRCDVVSLIDKQMTPFSIQYYHSHKFRRLASSTLMAEAASLCETLTQCQWMQR
eukprot:8602-Amphidinium_carterae.2